MLASYFKYDGDCAVCTIGQEYEHCYCWMLYSGVSEFKKNEDKVRGSVRLSSARIYFVGHCDRVLEKKEKVLFVWLSFGN